MFRLIASKNIKVAHELRRAHRIPNLLNQPLIGNQTVVISPFRAFSVIKNEKMISGLQDVEIGSKQNALEFNERFPDKVQKILDLIRVQQQNNKLQDEINTMSLRNATSQTNDLIKAMNQQKDKDILKKINIVYKLWYVLSNEFQKVLLKQYGVFESDKKWYELLCFQTLNKYKGKNSDKYDIISNKTVTDEKVIFQTCREFVSIANVLVQNLSQNTSSQNKTNTEYRQMIQSIEDFTTKIILGPNADIVQNSHLLQNSEAIYKEVKRALSKNNNLANDSILNQLSATKFNFIQQDIWSVYRLMTINYYKNMQVISLIQNLLELINCVKILNIHKSNSEIGKRLSSGINQYFQRLDCLQEYLLFLRSKPNVFDYLQLFCDSNSQTHQYLTAKNQNVVIKITNNLKRIARNQDQNVQNLNLLIEKLDQSISERPKHIPVSQRKKD